MTRVVRFVVVVFACVGCVCAQSADTTHETNVYTYLAPLTLLLIAPELIYLGVTKRKLLSFQEAISNLGTALGNQTMNVLVAASVYLITIWISIYFRPRSRSAVLKAQTS